ncbi:hypothetical protein [Capnocytophaga canis]|uniref:Uncharacterized protein n=1 Tax=Capnocytophaga canis TaxID=1848903 RepID=A0A0B7IRU3_9FLAO|nr:hypothetical protein [Capnocytophaga canis]CEN52678.1 hypothetical protein CCAND93_280008 [Capnocytophaga canis]
MEVKFKVTKILDTRKSKSTLELGKQYVGVQDIKRKEIIWWTDPANDQEWVFYVGETCELVD